MLKSVASGRCGRRALMTQLLTHIQQLYSLVGTCAVDNCDAAYNSAMVVAAHVADVLGGLAC